jgi:hypothetical protein
LAALDITWRVDHAALLLSLPGGLKASTNDLGGQFHRRLASLRVPRIFVKFLLRSQAEHRRWLEVCELDSDAYLDVYFSPAGWKEKAEKQAAFIEEQDLPSGRAERMFGGLESNKKGISFLMIFFAPFPNSLYLARFVHRNGVFLPQPELSDHRRYRSMERPPTAKPPGRQAENRASWQKLSHLSESDSGEGILDTDRDARLA